MSPNFERQVFCLLGLPFDAIDLAGAVRVVQSSARARTPCFFSTPNTNFVVTAQRDDAFRASVYRSDLSLIDGMPLLWMARLLGLPFRERVAGSALFEALRRSTANPISVYFFGGPDGVAAAAAQQLNAQPQGLHCVGHDSPGFVPVEAMSDAARIARINASAADFVVVSLGAKKGQAWIERNRARLRAPVISHLGAVVNFVAGTVRRAPGWMQRSGIEWLWRIREEPALWRRYAQDAMAASKLLCQCVIPYAWHLYFNRPDAAEQGSASVQVERGAATTVVHLRGAWAHSNLGPVRRAFTDVAGCVHSLRLDLSAVTHVDSAFVALLGLLKAHRDQNGQQTEIIGVLPSVRRVFGYCCALFLLDAQPPKAQVTMTESAP